MSVFLDAAAKGKLKYINQQLKAGYNPERDVDRHGNSALLLSVINNREDVMRVLMTANANIERENYNGDTALIIACRSGFMNILLILLEAGVNINAQNSVGRTALIEAILNNHVDIANILIDRGINIDLEADNGANALDLALTLDQEIPQNLALVSRLNGNIQEGPPLTLNINFGENVCGICQDNYTNGNPLFLLNCNHIFHQECINQSIGSGRNTCPMCVRRINTLRPLIINPTLEEDTTGKYFLGGYYNKYQKYISKMKI